MAYIIENVNMLKNGHLDRTSLIIEQNRISYIKPSLDKYRLMRMNGDSYIMAPTFAIYDPNVPIHESFLKQKDYYCRQFIRKGCTFVLTYANVDYECELQEKIKQYEKGLLNSPIDYAIGVKIPIRLLTPSFMRQCKQRQIPAIFVDIKSKEELYDLPWGWIREALFPLNPPLIPVFSGEWNKKMLKQTKLLWQKITINEKLPSLKDEMVKNHPLSEQQMARIKIYPLKASIQQGREVSYNFYEFGEINLLDDCCFFEQYEDKLLVTVHKGAVIRAGEQVFFQPGCGEHIKLNSSCVHTHTY